MALINHKKKEINSKIVYFGPSSAGKTKNMEFIYKKLRPEYRGVLKSLNTQQDRMIFFDFMPPELGQAQGYNVRFHLYTVNGDVTSDATWKMVLKGADAIVFVADSAPERMPENRDYLDKLQQYLAGFGNTLAEIPCIIQCNKSDLLDIFSVSEIKSELGAGGFDYMKASARNGEGVLQTLSAIVKKVMSNLREMDLGDGETVASEISGEMSGLVEESTPCIPEEVSKPVSRGGASAVEQEPAVPSPSNSAFIHAGGVTAAPSYDNSVAGMEPEDNLAVELLDGVIQVSPGRFSLPLQVSSGGKIKVLNLTVSLDLE